MLQLHKSISLPGEAYSLGPARLMIYGFQDEFFHSCQQMMLPRIFLVMLDLSSSEGPLGPLARRPILGKASFQEERVKSVDWVIFFFTAAVTRILMCHMWKKNDNFGSRGGLKTPDGCVAVRIYMHQRFN